MVVLVVLVGQCCLELRVEGDTTAVPAVAQCRDCLELRSHYSGCVHCEDAAAVTRPLMTVCACLQQSMLSAGGDLLAASNGTT